MKSRLQFIVIDDDPVNNALCKIVIRIVNQQADVRTFTTPEEGFQFISNRDENGSEKIILLDLNMPTMNGWEFLKNFEKLDESVKNKFRIYILSSSVSSLDREKASANKNVVDYIVKPLTNEVVSSISTESDPG